jgi:hypothetical protein
VRETSSFHNHRVLGKAASYRELVMEIMNEVQTVFATPSEVGLIHRSEESKSRKQPSVLGWYRILRAHYQLPLLEAIRYALWLSR